MATLVITECRRCSTTYNAEEDDVKIEGLEQVYIVLKKVARCIYCPPNDRAAINPRNIIPDYKGWDDDEWKTKSKK